MPYRLRAGESVRRGIARIVKEEIDSAIQQLTKGKNRDEAIHDARKSVKKIRGALRLVRFDMGKRFSEENAVFRDIGRKLSELRDAQALLEVFDQLQKKYKDRLGPKALDSVRKGLLKRKELFEAASNVPHVVEEVVESLTNARSRIETWPLHSNGFAAVAPGLARTFRQGKAAFAIAYEDSTAESFHEFRKRAKDHWYHIRLLENLWTPLMEAYENSLKCLEQRLGDDHNLVILRTTILNDPVHFSNKHELNVLYEAADAHRDELRAEAQNIAERIYSPKTREFIAHMQHLWEAWKHEAERSWARRTLAPRPRTKAAKTA